MQLLNKNIIYMRESGETQGIILFAVASLFPVNLLNFNISMGGGGSGPDPAPYTEENKNPDIHTKQDC